MAAIGCGDQLDFQPLGHGDDGLVVWFDTLLESAGGQVLSDLATWIRALGGGKVFNAEYQKIWQDSAKRENPKNSYNWYGYGIAELRWGQNVIDLHGGQTPGFNSEALYDPNNDMTLVIWGNLTMALNNQYTAVVLMLKVLDLIYVNSPVPPASPTTGTTGTTNSPTG